MSGPDYELKDKDGKPLGPVNRQGQAGVYAYLLSQVNRMNPVGARTVAVVVVYNRTDAPCQFIFGGAEYTAPACGQECAEAPAFTRIVTVITDGGEVAMTEFPVDSYCD